MKKIKKIKEKIKKFIEKIKKALEEFERTPTLHKYPRHLRGDL